MTPDDAPPTPTAEAISALIQPPPQSMADQKPDNPFYEPNGYLNLQGDQAVEHSAPTQQWLKDQADELIKAEPEGESRDRLRLELAQMYAQAHRQVEDHTSKALEASVRATNEANLAATRTAVTLNPEDDAVAALQFAKSVGSATHGALNPADKEARTNAWHGVLAADRLTALIDKGDWTKAEAVMNDNRQVLGTGLKSFEVKIQGHKVQVEAQSTASAFVNASLDKQTGTVDEQKMNALLETVSPEKRKLVTEVSKEVQTRVEHAAEQARKETATEQFKKINMSSFWLVPPDVRSKLNQADPALYDRLKNEAERKFRLRNASTAEQNREQRAVDDAAKDDYNTEGDGTAATRSEVDLEDFIMHHPGVSRHAAKAIEAKHQRDQAMVKSGDSVKEAAFAADVKKLVGAGVKGKQAQKQAVADGAELFDNFVIEHKRPPTRDEAMKLQGQILEKTVVPGLLFDSEVPGYEVRASDKKAVGKASRGAQVLPTVDLTKKDAAPVTKKLGDKVFIKNSKGKWVTGG